MTKPVIVTRQTKGSPLTRTELDNNFTNINDAVIIVTGDTGSITNSLNESFQISGGVATTSQVIADALIIDLNDTAVTPGSYTSANITVDQQGRITSAANGSVSPAGSDKQIQFNNSGALGASSGLTFDGGNLKCSGNVESQFSSGDEGGEFLLAKPATNTTLAGNVSIDIYQNKLRIFENGGSTRGAYIDLTAASSSVGTNLLSGGGGMTSFTAAGDTGTSQTVSDGNTLTIAGGTGLSSVASATDTITINLDDTAVTAASYTAANITVDAQGRITSASNGTVGATTLDELTDVVITAAATNDVLVYNGTNWVDTAASTLTVSAASTATTATNANNINISTTNGNSIDTLLSVVLVGAQTTGNQLPHIDDGLTYNASTNALTAASFIGSLSGNATSATTATTATNATNININTTSGNSNDNSLYPVLVGAASTGNQLPHIDSTGLAFNATTNTLTLGSSGASNAAGLIMFSNNTASITLSAPTSLSASYTLTLPPDDGGTSSLLQSNGSGTLTWVNAINSTSIGATTSSTGAFTGLTAKGATNTAKLTLDTTSVSSTAWTTSGIGLKLQGATFTDTSSTAGTVANEYVHVISAPTVAHTNSVTVSQSASLAVSAPNAGTNTTLTNKYAIWNEGNMRVTGNLSVDGTFNANSGFNGTIGASTPNTGSFTTLTAATTTLDDIRETVYNIGNSSTSTLTPDAANGSVQTITATGNFTLSAFANPVSGQSITFIITQDATGSRTLTSTMKFAGASKTLTTAANSIDILTVSYIGTTYYASLSKGFA